MRNARARPILIGVLLLTGCMLGSDPFTTPAPSEFSDLAETVERDPTDIEAALLLAAGYLAAGRLEDARGVLDVAHTEVPGDPTVVMAMGVVEQELGMYQRALDHYTDFLVSQRSSSFASQIEARFEAILPAALREDARGQLAGETAVGGDVPDSLTIAVLPFAFDPQQADQAEPLSVALAEVLAWDLDGAPFEVVAPELVRTLVDEMTTDAAQLSHLSVAARAGTLLGAGRVVQGRISAPTAGPVAWDVTVVTLSEEGQMSLVPLRAEGDAGSILDLEKRMAFMVHGALGEYVQPVDAGGVNRRQTVSVEALLAFGRGLTASNTGDHSSAQAFFAEAVELDAEFTQAGSRAARAASAVAASLLTPSVTLEEGARIGEMQRAVQALRSSPNSVQQQSLDRVGARERAVLAEILGWDHVGVDFILDLTFTVFTGPVP